MEPEVAGVILQDIARMRPERDDHAPVAALPGSLHQLLQKKTVPEMDTVKKSCGYNHLTSPKSCL